MTYLRKMPQVTKDKISSSLQGRKLSDETKERISQGVKKAWAKVPKTVEIWGTERNNDNDKTDNTNEKSKI